MKYDAIIVGASFAGLAVASRLRGDILLIDRKDIGTGQTSACGTPLSVVQPLQCMDSVLQVYHRGFIHTHSRTIAYDLPYPFCAFDYYALCQGLARRAQADFLRARVTGLKEGHVVMTDRGEFTATCLVDSSGWRAVLATSGSPDPPDLSTMGFGIETTVKYRAEGLHFWLDPRLINMGAAWLFPCGEQARIGVGSYLGETRLKASLTSFLGHFGLSANGIHGGFLSYKLKEPVAGQVFVVGDAAGQCEPLTGAGIGPALFFGARCAEIIQAVIDRGASLNDGLQRYARLVQDYHRYYSFLERAQRRMLSMPELWQGWLLTLFSLRPISHFLLNCYRKYSALEKSSGDALEWGAERVSGENCGPDSPEEYREQSSK